MGAVGKSVVEHEDEKRPTDDHFRTGLNAATNILPQLTTVTEAYPEKKSGKRGGG